ncbi:RT0821/Lpp0805 family surface protein [Azospirillum soli]|uniref:RT0821/Lpp0805 family surface protein n=1 Tax=Azospirillum soli TaxID=1304799 RepID=UPI001AE60CDC|nr:RT0821/Lpp0805 family surface protein [Azospirillum soli]MBP2313142.1 surface antigen [Azospirillum soli]
MKKIAVTLVVALSLAGCAQSGGGYGTGYGTKQTVGTLGGAVAGGLVGSRFGGGTGKMVAVGLGTLLGAYAGSEFGKSLDRADETYAQQAASQAYAAPLGQTVQWNNPQSGNYGTITPTRDGYSNTGAYCREYQQTVYVNGRAQQASGQACQQPDGTWRIMS